MIENYEILSNGIIKQIEVNKIPYNVEYVETRYNTYNDKVINMSHLRLGYIIGSIGKIPNSILDVGYGNGGFLSVCKEIIPNCYGNDISDYKLISGCHFVSDIINHECEVITFFDSLEHFDDIYFVKDLKVQYLCISLPWCHNFSDEWFKNWKHLRPDEHLYHFDNVSLTTFMLEMGFELINFSNIEDIIRKPSDSNNNILTAIFKKI